MSSLVSRAGWNGEPLSSYLLAASLHMDGFSRAPSTQTILAFLAEQSDGRSYVAELRRATGLSSGTLVPAIKSLIRKGWLTETVEEGTTSDHKRPLLNYLTITETGRAGLDELAQSSISETLRLVDHLEQLRAAHRAAARDSAKAQGRRVSLSPKSRLT